MTWTPLPGVESCAVVGHRDCQNWVVGNRKADGDGVGTCVLDSVVDRLKTQAIQVLLGGDRKVDSLNGCLDGDGDLFTSGDGRGLTGQGLRKSFLGQRPGAHFKDE